MEEWRPLRTIPELLAIVHEGLTAERPSLVTPEPPPAPAQRTSAPPAARTRPEPHRSAPTPAPRSNVVSLTSRLATAEKLEPEEPLPVADPFAASTDSHKSPISGIDSVAAVPNVAVPTAAAPTVVIPRKAGPNWIVIGMVVAFGAFGATAGIAVFFNKQPPPAPAPTIVVTTQAPAPTVATGQAAPSAAGTDNVVTINPGDMNGKPATGGVKPQGTGATAAAGTGTQRAVDPSIAALLGGPGGGPSVGGGSGGGSAGSALSEEAISRVVQQRSAGVKRTCWERGGGTESNVNVRVHLTIAATGNVQSTTAEGNDPIVSKCIENSVRNWTFPVSSGPTTVDIPFHFLRQ
jgi:hypothetical protein